MINNKNEYRIFNVINGFFSEISVNGFAPVSFAYIDPGTGSMLFTVLVGAVSVFLYGIKGLLIKLQSSKGRLKEDKNR